MAFASSARDGTDIEEFRGRGQETVYWMADYMERVEDLPVLSQVTPGEGVS